MFRRIFGLGSGLENDSLFNFKGDKMIVHLDLIGDELLYCNKCEESVSNDAWLVIRGNSTDKVLCGGCYRCLEPKVKNDG